MVKPFQLYTSLLESYLHRNPKSNISNYLYTRRNVVNSNSHIATNTNSTNVKHVRKFSVGRQTDLTSSPSDFIALSLQEIVPNQLEEWNKEGDNTQWNISHSLPENSYLHSLRLQDITSGVGRLEDPVTNSGGTGELNWEIKGDIQMENEVPLSESNDQLYLLKRTKDAVEVHGSEILSWMRTNRSSLIRHIEEDIIQLFRNAERFAAMHGLLLPDVELDDLKAHVNSTDNLRDLFSPKFINEQKLLLYGDSQLPLLRNRAGYSMEEEPLSIKRQELIERLSFSEAIKSARVEASSLLELQKPSELPALSSTCSQWVSDIANFIKEDRRNNAASVIPSQLDEYSLANATVRIALQLMCFPAYALDSKGQKGSLMRRRTQQTAGNQVLLAHAAVRLGDEVSKMYLRLKMKEEVTENVNSIDEPFMAQATDTIGSFPSILSKNLTITALSCASQARVISNLAIEEHAVRDEDKQWNGRQSAAVGGYLLNALVKSCYVQVDLPTAIRQVRPIDDIMDDVKRRDYIKYLSKYIRKSRFDEGKVEVPAFGHRMLRQGVRTYGVLEMKECCMLQLRDAVARGLITLCCLPMVCKPRPWTSVSNGGTLLLKHYFIRTNNKPTFDVRVYDLSRVLSIVSSFGKVPWKINKSVLDVLKMLWSGDCDLPLRKFLPDTTLINTNVCNVDVMTRANALSECSLFEKRLRIAQDFLNEPRIYLPQNIDFRGRMYPLSPHLNHMSDDVCRGLLKFSEARPLGARGFYWLKIHVANLYGIDKVSFADRLAWVESNMNLLNNLVASPYSELSQAFWSKAENPFQFYAAVVELISAVNSGDVESYMSSIPVQQDGSCNGLQHYAALGRDLKGGRSVNLLPGDTPQDVYQEVLLEVINKVRLDYSTSGNKSALAKICLEHSLLRRKIVKQTVMTICYGVTKIGAIAQIEQKLQEIESLNLSSQVTRQLASYIAGKVLGSIKSVFNEAMSIKKWLDDISMAHNKLNVPVTWISPIGLPCEQPYCKTVTRVVRTPIQAINIAEHEHSSIDKRRQKLAFPPNFIHSLDASHLMLTAEAVFSKGLHFAAVHDSYWTHADSVDYMNQQIRQQFVNMHSEPILEILYNNCNNRLRGNTIINPPPLKGQLDLSLVLDSNYFFH